MIPSLCLLENWLSKYWTEFLRNLYEYISVDVVVYVRKNDTFVAGPLVMYELGGLTSGSLKVFQLKDSGPKNVDISFQLLETEYPNNTLHLRYCKFSQTV